MLSVFERFSRPPSQPIAEPLLPQARPSSQFLDGLRGLAAVYVLLHHALLWLHPGYQNGYVKHPSEYNAFAETLLKSLYIFKYGRCAVILFFVLSGFVIHLRYAKRAAWGQPLPISEWGPFLIRRARRLYPPLILALTLTLVVDVCGKRLGYAIYSGRSAYKVLNENVGDNHSAITLLGNLLFLMQSYVPTWGTDGSLWSLKYEWWFYVFYPLTWLMGLGRTHWWATCVVFTMSIMSLFPKMWPLALLADISSKMTIWWLGALLAEVYVGRVRIRFRQISPLGLLVPLAAVLSARGFHVFEFVWGMGFVGVIACGFAWLESGRQLRWIESLKPLGDCSYTLYVIHAPLLIFASGWLMARSPSGELPNSLMPAFCSLLILPLAYLFHLIVERPFAGKKHEMAAATLRSSVPVAAI